MRNLKITRSMILTFIFGMSLSQLSVGIKLCIAAPLVIVWLMSYDEKKINFRRESNVKNSVDTERV